MLRAVILPVLVVSFSSCVVNGRTFNPLAMAANADAEQNRERQAKIDAEERKKADAKAATDRAEAEKKRAEKAAAEEKRMAELKQQAAQMKAIHISELGVEVTAPGDVQVKPHTSSAYGAPALMVSGEASHFDLIVTDAKDDRYGLDERIRRQQSQFRWGMDVIRQGKLPNGGWEFEFSYPEYFNDGSRAGTRMGYFSRQVVGGKEYNCLISDLPDSKLTQAVNACRSLKVAKAP